VVRSKLYCFGLSIFLVRRSAGVMIRGGICAIFGGPELFTTFTEHLFVHGGGPKKMP